jgi:hypothetical protein
MISLVILFFLLAGNAHANLFQYNGLVCDPKTVLYENKGVSSATETCSPGRISGQSQEKTVAETAFIQEWNLHSYSDTINFNDATCSLTSSTTRLRLNDVQYYTVLGNVIPRCDDTSFWFEDSSGQKKFEKLLGSCQVDSFLGQTSQFITCFHNPNATKTFPFTSEPSESSSLSITRGHFLFVGISFIVKMFFF